MSGTSVNDEPSGSEYIAATAVCLPFLTSYTTDSGRIGSRMLPVVHVRPVRVVLVAGDAVADGPVSRRVRLRRSLEALEVLTVS